MSPEILGWNCTAAVHALRTSASMNLPINLPVLDVSELKQRLNLVL